MNELYLCDFKAIPAKHIVSQKDCLEWIAKMHAKAETIHSNLSHEDSSAFLEKIQQMLDKISLGEERIRTRGLQIQDLYENEIEKMPVYNIASCKSGLGLGKKMTVYSEEIDPIMEKMFPGITLPEHIIHVSCTGYVSPSPAQKLVSKREAKNTFVTHSYHMGCYGAFPAIRIANLSSSKTEIVHTEFCTLHMNPSLHTVEQLVVESLFADGFIKYAASKEQKPISLKVISLKEILIPDSLTSMSWQCEDFGFGMRLSKDVPVKISKAITPYLHSLCENTKLNLSDLLQNAIFAIHPGGPKIIEQIQKMLNLRDDQVFHSKQTLLTNGNMSSATLPHIWQKILSDTSVRSNTNVVSMAFGPGLTISGAIMQKKDE